MKMIIAVTIVAFLVGCKAESLPPTQSRVQGGDIEMVTLKDGTRCAVFKGYKAGGLSCDWSGKE